MSSHFDAPTLQNLLSIGETLSSAVPGAGPFLTAGLQLTSLFLPTEEQQSAFQRYVAALSNQFSEDQEEAAQLLDYLETLQQKIANSEWADIYQAYNKYVAPSDSVDSVQVQEGLLYQDFVPKPGKGVKGSRHDFNGLAAIFPLWFSMASSRLALASFAPKAEFETNQNATFTDIRQASSIINVVELAGSRYGALLAYCNLCVLDRFRRVYYDWTGAKPAVFPVVHDDATGYSRENPDILQDEWVARRWAQVADDALSFLSTTDDRGKPWQSALQWYAVYTSWLAQLSPTMARPLAAPPAPLTFSNWCYGDATEIKRFNDDFWGPQRLLIYYYTLVSADGKVETPPSPVLALPTVDDNNGYGCVLNVPADATGLAASRRIYKTVIAPKEDDGNEYAETEIENHQIGELTGSSAGQVTDQAGLKLK